MANQPAHKVSIGLISGTIWKNDANGRSFFAVILSRSYKDGDEWKNTDQLGHSDLLNAGKVLERCEAWIAEQE